MSNLRGSIAAQEINQKYLELEGKFALGFPISENIIQDNTIYKKEFEGGELKWMDGQIDPRTKQYYVHIEYVGLKCINTTSGLGSDEPYILITAYNPADQFAKDRVTKFPMNQEAYEQVDDGTIRPEIRDVLPGAPLSTVVIHVDLWENDNGSPEESRRKVENSFRDAVTAAELFGVQFPFMGSSRIVEFFLPKIASFVSDVLGLEDDYIDSDSIRIGADELARFKDQNSPITGSLTPNAPYNLVTKELVGDGGKYQAFFRFWVESGTQE
jgi:hypothetical protein